MAYVVHLKNVLPLKLLYIKRKRSTITLLEGNSVTSGVKAHKLLMKTLLRMKWKVLGAWTSNKKQVLTTTYLHIFNSDTSKHLHLYYSRFKKQSSSLQFKFWGQLQKTWSGFPKVH